MYSPIPVPTTPLPEPGYHRDYADDPSRGGLTIWKLFNQPPFRVVETNRSSYDVEQLTTHADALARWLHIVRHTS